MPAADLTDLARDERLARLLAELLERPRADQDADLETTAAAHPDLARELRELWAAAQFAARFAPRTGSRSGRPSRGPLEPARVTPPPGRTFGDFVLLEEIGRGGMGVVYKAWQTSLSRIVALKMILRGEHAT